MKPVQLGVFDYQTPPGFIPYKKIGNLGVPGTPYSYTVTGADIGSILDFISSGAESCTLPLATNVGVGFNFWIWSSKSTGILTITPNGSQTINGNTSLTVSRGQGIQLFSDGTNWQIASWKWPIGFSYDAANSPTNLAVTSATGALAIGYNTSANAGWQTAIGANSGGSGSQAVTGAGAMALGGSYASGTDSFAAANTDNTGTYGAKGANSVAIGKLALASNTSSTAIGAGYNSNPQSTSVASMAIGDGAVASNSGAIAIGNMTVIYGPAASGAYSFALGPGSTSAIWGKYAYSPADLIGGTFAKSQQYGLMVLTAVTTSATPVVLQSDGTNGTTPSTNNQVILPNSTAYAFTGTVVARQQAAGGTASAAWTVQGLIRREGSAATTTLVASTVLAISNIPLWTLALSADTTNGGLAITATGAASTNIRWVANIQTSEVLYA
jgi:hypothetical protein